MAIRYYCDHCGLEIVHADPHHFIFGPVHDLNNENGYPDEPDDNWNSLNSAIPNQVANIECIRLQLCGHCAPIWMRRVQGITNDSTPQPKSRTRVKKTDA